MSSNISGFPEFLPKEQIVFNKVMEIIKSKFELYGFIPLDTPAVEKTSTLLSKGNDKEIYGIYRLAGEEGNNKKDLGLRFDLKVPLARYVAQYQGQLLFPYRRYQIAPVWRGERPKAGRYRQFYQCDIDVIGDGELSLVYDAEVLAIIYDILSSIGIEQFSIKINNRKILTSLIKSFGITDDIIEEVMRVIDKVEKIPLEQFKNELSLLQLNTDNITLLLELINKNLSNNEWISYLRTIINDIEFQCGVSELEEVLSYAEMFDIPSNFIRITPSLARGLNYYTGIIYETILDDCPELGSICGGGRYANLSENFTNRKLPGVGISIGLSRLVPRLIAIGLLKADKETIANILVTTQNYNYIDKYLQITQYLRKSKINTEIYLQDKPLNAQMKYASKKGFKFVVIADKLELDANTVILRNLQTGEQIITLITNLVEAINSSIE